MGELTQGLSPETEVPTPDGWRLLGDMRVGDEAFGLDGRPTRVTECRERRYGPMLRVTFEDGCHVDAAAGHLWSVRRTGESDLETVTTEELMARVMAEDPLTLRSIEELNVPMPKPVERHGMATGDPGEIGRRCGNVGYPVPDACMLGSVSQRRALLEGILGSHTMPHEGHRHVSRRMGDELAAQVIELASSLGMPCALDNGCPGTAVVYDWPDDGKLVVEVERIPDGTCTWVAVESRLYLAGRGHAAVRGWRS